MEEKKTKRKLTAIFSADVKGYSRLMQDDEEATVRTITAYRGVMSSLIQEHDGRVVDAKGDNVLAEFPSVVDAVRCGVKIQKELKVKNDEMIENRRMEFRIGINLGDVIEKEETIYGDGVNIAARLEGLAEGGGICISRTAFDHVKNKLDVGYEYLGEHLVKNIVEPVCVYKVLMEPEYADRVIGEKRTKPSRWLRKAIAAIVILFVVAGALAVWNFYFRRPSVEPASVEKMAYPLPDKPSIAVLPLDNLSDDPKQEYFSDGLTEEIITALSKEKRLFVIARNSTFTYKRKPVKVQQVAEELGVRYVLEGSVRKSEDRVRVTAQLIDAVKGHHLWAERYDRPLKEIFALQDEITMKILTALQVKLTEGQQARVFAGGTEDFDAYLKFLEARALAFRYSEQDIMAAKRLLEEAIAIDPTYASAYRAMAGTHLVDAVMGFTKSPKDSIKKAIGLAKKAIELDQSMASAYALLGFIFAKAGQYDLGISEAQKAVELDPNCADCYAHLGVALHYAGRAEEAVPNLEKAIRLNPFPPNSYWGYLAAAHIYLGHYEDAIGLINKAIKNTPTDLAARISLVLAHSLSGHEKDAHAAAGKLLEMNPKFSIEQYKKMSSHKDRAFLERCAAALHKAGLPETPPLPLPDKPSIAVLPFTNMSDDPKQEYFSDGITEEIITALSKTPKLFVIARNSTFTYKNKPTKVQQIGRELGVKYVLEGSVRKAGNKVRVTAQLVDAKTGHHLWAERYDRVLKDIFAIQDDITKNIIAEIQVQLTEGIQATLLAGGTRNLMAYLKTLEAVSVARRVTVHEIALMKHLSEEAIALDPEYAAPYAILGNAHLMDLRFGVSKSPKESMGKAIKFCTKSLSLDGSNLTAIGTLSFCYATIRKHDEAIRIAEQGIAKMPGAASAHMSLGRVLVYSGRHREAIESLKLAIRMNPYPPTHYFFHLGDAHFLIGEYKDAILAYKKAADISPNSFLPHIGLAAVYGLQGREAEARSEAEKILKIYPKYSLEASKKRSSFKNPEDTNRFYQGLSKAGLK